MKRAFACLSLATLLAGTSMGQSTGKPPAFEIADVRVNDTPLAPATRMAGPFIAGGRYTLRAATMLDLIVAAYGVDPDMVVGGPAWLEADRFDITAKNLIQRAWNINNMNLDETLVGPKFLDTERFDTIAKTPDHGTEEAYRGPAPDLLDLEGIFPMLRTLLINRFKMTFHYEDRPIRAYTLTAAKPKLQKANPSNRTGCHENVGLVERDPRAANPQLRLITCTNMTMAQFVERLPQFASATVRGASVLDATGLAGAWDFTFDFSGAALASANAAGGNGTLDAPSSAPVAADPTATITLFDALEKQLGLKLEVTKRPGPVLVIDHMEQKPTDN